MAALAAAGALAGAAAAEPVQTRQEIEDAAAVKAIQDELKTPTDLAPDLAKLQTVLSHAPARFPRIEAHDDVVIVRASGRSDFEALTAAVRKGPEPQRSLPLEPRFNTYAMASLLIGSYYVETRAPKAALEALEVGLALQPDNPVLLTEKGSALTLLGGRYPEELAMYDAWLASGGVASDRDRARIQRARGFALTELGRLDEAERAYLESLELDPTHAGARHELAYISELRLGGARGGTAVLTGDKAAEPDSPPGP